MSADQPAPAGSPNPENQEPAAPQLPSCPPPAADKPKTTWLNPLGVAAVLLVIVFTALIIHNEKRSRSPLELLPLNTSYYMSSANSAGARQARQGLAIWADKNSETAKSSLADCLWYADFARTFGQLSPDNLRILDETVLRYGEAQISLLGSASRIFILECGSAWDVKKVFTAATHQKIAKSGFSDSYKITVSNGNDCFFALLKPYAVFTRSQKDLETIIACWRGQQPSLGAALRSRPFTYETTERTEIFTRKLTGRMNIFTVLDYQKSCAPGACILAEAALKDGRLLARADFLDIPAAPAAPECEGCGVFGYILWTLGIICAVIIAVPVLFLLTVLVFACWFHITSKLRHENVPTVAPELPPLSPELEEDLGVKTPETPAENNVPADSCKGESKE